MKIIINITETDKNKCPYCTYKGTIEFQTIKFNKSFSLKFENATELLPGDCPVVWCSSKYDVKLSLETEQFLKENNIDIERINFILPKTVLKGKIGKIEAELEENSFLLPKIIKSDF